MTKVVNFLIVQIRGLVEFFGNPDTQSILYSGLNGTGKTAMLYAIDFAITGKKFIPLHLEFDPDTGEEFFPHIEFKDQAKNARVELELSYGEEGKTFTVTRYVNSPDKPKLVPDNTQTRKTFAELSAQHQRVLSRQNLLNFVKAQPEARAKMLEVASGKEKISIEREKLEFDLARVNSNLETSMEEYYESYQKLAKLLKVEAINGNDILVVVNRYRREINLEPLNVIPEDQNFLTGAEKKESYLKTNLGIIKFRLSRFLQFLDKLPNLANIEVQSQLENISKLEKDENLLLWPKIHSLIEEVKELQIEKCCPVCDTELQSKVSFQNQISKALSKKPAQKLWKSINENNSILVKQIENITKQFTSTIGTFSRIGQSNLAEMLENWCSDLEHLKVQLLDPKKLVEVKKRLQSNWVGIPEGSIQQFDKLYESIKLMPAEGIIEDYFGGRDSDEIEKILESAQWSYQEYILNNEKLEQAKENVNLVKAEYREFSKFTDAELNAEYSEIAKNFSKFYRYLISDEVNVEEKDLDVKLESEQGELRFDVVFHNRGTFPPTALHSEGYQDVIGICMFLAVMHHEREGNVPFMLLDDVLTSVDENHRDQVCKLLKKFFKDTQIIATTHDRVMARHFRNRGLIDKEVRLVGWNLKTGPKTYQVDNWLERINKLLELGDIEMAAHQLRYHLEGVFYNIACDLGAMVNLRRDNQYDFGELKDGVVARVNKLVDGAKIRINTKLKADPKNLELVENLNVVKKFQRQFKRSVNRADDQQWLINPTLHNNPSQIVSKNELEETVSAYANLLNCLQCPKCNRWLDLRKLDATSTPLECIRDHMNFS